MLEHLLLVVSLLTTSQAGLGTIFGSSTWDANNPVSRLACYHREIDDEKDFVVAHNTLACGRPVLIYNPRTGLSVLATVGDRGPRHAMVDLARPVAKAISHNGRETVVLVPLPHDPTGRPAKGRKRIARAGSNGPALAENDVGVLLRLLEAAQAMEAASL